MTDTRAKILVIDDDPMVTLLLDELLGGMYELGIAASGAEGIALAQANPPDLVLLDVVMPDLDGFETCRRLRAVKELSHTKVLLVSGMSRCEERVQGYEAGADDFLTKPFDGAELLAKVRVYLRLKKAEELDRLKTAFLANMSHEIRTPLNAVFGMTELVLETQLSAEQREQLSTVSQSSRTLLAIIDDILDWSKIESGRLEVERVPFDLRELLAETMRALSVQSGDKTVEIVLDIDPQVPGEVIGDPLRMRQVLTNLLGNAFKFTSAGEVVLGVAVTAHRDDQVDLRITVRDTGIGISEVQQRNLFESFYQADTSTTRRFGGTGLGLAISRRLAQLMGGSLSLRSAVGQGSTFVVDLPMRVTKPPPPSVFAGQHVLSIDDHPVAGPNARRILVELGLAVTTCSNSEAALAAIATPQANRRSYAAVLLAYGRPALDTDKIVDALRSAAPSLPIVLSVPHRLLHHRRTCDRGLPYVLRPLIPVDLRRALQTSLATDIASPSLAAARPEPERRLRVLVTEDNPVNQRLACGVLERDGHECVVANNGEECLSRLATDRFDLVLMDVQMPVLDGLEATRRVRANEIGTQQHIPIVGLTANAFAEDRERCLAAGMDAYLAKPFRIGDLRDLIRQHAR